MNPVYADAVVDNMATTMLRLFGLTLSSYPNVLKQTVETMAKNDPRIVRRGQKRIFVGSAAMSIDLSIDVLEADDDFEPIDPPELPSTKIGSYEFTVKDVVLRTDDDRQEVLADVVIKQVDYETDEGKSLKDKDDFKFERTVQVAFYIKESAHVSS